MTAPTPPTSAAASTSRSGDTPTLQPPRGEWHALGQLLPYLREYRGRVALALLLLVLAKFANIGVPLLMKRIVDGFSGAEAIAAVPVTLLAAYGLLRMSATLFGELRDIVFVRVTQRAARRIALSVFRHLHALSLRFHLERQTGGVSRDIERGTRGISTLMSYLIFSVLPTLLELVLVTALLYLRLGAEFALITLGGVAVYIAATFAITEWRTHHRRTMNDEDSRANTKAIDSLLNYETVKYFSNEEYEAQRYDANLQRYEGAAVKSESSLGVLNAVQSAVIALTVTLLMWRAAVGIVAGQLTLGDLVMVNALLIQLYVPLNFFGVMYREIKQALTDLERMFRLLNENQEVRDKPGAPALDTQRGAAIHFEQVDFNYEARRQILHGVDFRIPAGHTVAVVGSSGAGKSTLSRLLFRFYDVGSGRITIDGQDIREVSQSSLRAALGIVPQDTVLFNDTIYYNIAYGRPDASRDEVIAAARAAHIHDFIERLPDGYDAMVGERGLKLSGGEKQRVAIARTLLKNPAILIFDEATSALDSRTERAIQSELKAISADRTTLVIAHRLSTVVDADNILVMEHGCVVEQGRFAELLSAGGRFAQMWQLQQEQRTTDSTS